MILRLPQNDSLEQNENRKMKIDSFQNEIKMDPADWGGNESRKMIMLAFHNFHFHCENENENNGGSSFHEKMIFIFGMKMDIQSQKMKMYTFTPRNQFPENGNGNITPRNHFMENENENHWFQIQFQNENESHKMEMDSLHNKIEINPAGWRAKGQSQNENGFIIKMRMNTAKLK